MSVADPDHRWPRPVPTVGDRTSAGERAADPSGWAMGDDVRATLDAVLTARRDIRRYRPDPVPDSLLRDVLAAGHTAPSVGHSQPWRFVVVREQASRDRAAAMSDRERLRQAEQLTPDRRRRLLDLQLEGLREAPVGIVVACDRRTAAAGVLGRASFPDTDLWSCACAIQNMWLAARAAGLGMGWVTLFRPDDLAGLLDLPDGVETLGWLCLGWPDERPPEPGLERRGWSSRLALDDVIVTERWPSDHAPEAPPSHLAPPPAAVVAARDSGDDLLAPPGALGVLDTAVDRVLALPAPAPRTGTLVLAAGRHPVTRHGVSAYADHVVDDVLAATAAGESLAAVTARTAGLRLVVADPGTTRAQGDLVATDGLHPGDVRQLLDHGRELGRTAAGHGLVCLGEVGVGNTTVAASLASALLRRPADELVGLGAGADTAMLRRKIEVVSAAVARADGPTDPLAALAALGGPEFAVLTGVALGAAGAGAAVVLDGLATSVAALLAVRLEPAVRASLVAGQRSRERGHGAVLVELGLEPLLDVRLRAGEGVGACLAAQMLLAALAVRHDAGRTG
ncbi:5,6-dimethylbenzimidazole synthase [Jatrophihabitans fulvus]